MSLPSIPDIAAERKYNLQRLTHAQREEVLVEAMRRDMPLAITLLHKKAHEAQEGSGSADWLEDPNSEIGRQLIRLHASDSLRPLASKHFCHGQQLTFINCCGGIVGTPPKNDDEDDENLDALHDRQIQSQVGPIAYADC